MIHGIHKIKKKKNYSTDLKKNQTFLTLRFEKKFSHRFSLKGPFKYVQNPYYIYPVTATSSMGLF